MIIAGRGAVSPIGRGKELDLVGDDIKRAALATVLRFVGAGLDGTGDGHLASLGQITAAEFGKLTPRDDVQEIRLLLAGLRVAKAAIDRDAEVANRNAGLGRSHFRVAGQIADQKNLIHMTLFPLLLHEVAFVQLAMFRLRLLGGSGLGLGLLAHGSDANRARLHAALLLKQLDDLRTDDVLVDAEITGELLGQLGSAVESDIHVITFGLVVDSVGQTTLAPLLNLDNLAAVGSDDTVELLDELLAGGLLDGGINDVDQFVLIHDPFTSFWTLALQCSMQNKDVPVVYDSTEIAKKQGLSPHFFPERAQK